MFEAIKMLEEFKDVASLHSAEAIQSSCEAREILASYCTLSVVKAWVGLTAAKIARAVRVCTRHRMLCNCGLLNTATLMFTFA